MAPKAYTKLPNSRLYTDERFRGACGAPPSLAGEPSPSPFGQVEARMTLRCLERLKPELRAVLAGTAVGNTADEIAAELGARPGTTNKRLHRGRKLLRKLLR